MDAMNTPGATILQGVFAVGVEDGPRVGLTCPRCSRLLREITLGPQDEVVVIGEIHKGGAPFRITGTDGPEGGPVSKTRHRAAECYDVTEQISYDSSSPDYPGSRYKFVCTHRDGKRTMITLTLAHLGELYVHAVRTGQRTITLYRSPKLSLRASSAARSDARARV